MQISDLLGQYNRNAATQPEAVAGVKGIQQLVSSIQELTAGNIFEGTVNSMKNGQVLLGLPNGQEVAARMDGKLDIQVGQSMFFQVKSNNGQTVAIRPFSVDANGGNLTLLDAVKAAGLAADSKNLSMVNAMMQEQMPIDKNHLANMARLAMTNSDISIQTLVQMQKLNIPISMENASQFENYLGDTQAITVEIENLISELPEVMTNQNLSGEELQQMGQEILSVLTENLENQEKTVLDPVNLQNPETINEENVTPQVNDVITSDSTHAQVENKNGIISFMSKGQLEEFEGQLKSMPHMENNEKVFVNGKLNSSLQPVELMKEIMHSISILDSSNPTSKDQLLRLFSGKGFQLTLKELMNQQWTVKPEELTKENKIQNLYEKLDQQIRQMEEIVKTTGQQNSNFTQTATDVRSNISFMNQINETYTYMQIPLKMTGQKANGELYVYSNKKSLEEGAKDLTAFLHLDMEHLGATDVSLRLHQKEVMTNFYMESDTAYDLIRENLSELEQRLLNKGYKCKVTVQNESKKVNFVEDFLKKDQPSAGQLRRYSFDMRA